ncbi:Alpha/Beta hydrolase protein, partial [Panaeolus papilionaceus]
PTPLTFELRHQHAVYGDSRIAFSDYSPGAAFMEQASFTIPSVKKRIPKPKSNAAFQAARWSNLRTSSHGQPMETLEWHDSDIEAPDVTRRDTLLGLAKMAANSYIADRPTSPTEWYDIPYEYQDVTGNWSSIPHGWGPDEDGLRGHVFATPDNSTVVISIKGTSAGWLVGGGGPTVGKDKKNDNLLFSCCCARVGPTWSTVCDCYDGGNKCDSECLEEAMKDEGLFYPIGLNLFNNVSYMYPNANIWMTGHSLGGGLASLLGITFGVPVVAFEAPAEKRAAERLHLPKPPSTHHVTHVYNTADPIPMGTCTGMTSSCAIGGFALETRCHLGQVIKYDTVSKLQWSVDIRNHGIILIIEKLLS